MRAPLSYDRGRARCPSRSLTLDVPHTTAIVVVVAIVALATFLQRLTGFGFALFSVPLMSLAISPTRAVVVASLCSFPNTIITAWQLRRFIDWPIAKRFALWSFVGMPFGLVILDAVPERPFRIFLGVVIAAATVAIGSGWRLRATRPSVDAAIGVISGVLATSTGTNGPPLVIGLHGRRLTPDVFRGTISAIFVASNASLVLFAARGKITHVTIGLAALAFPTIPVMAYVGLRAARRMRDAHFERLVLALLLATAASAIIGGIRG